MQLIVRTSRFAALFSLVLSASGCGNGPVAPPPADTGPRRDTGTRDAGLDAPFDSASDAPMGDVGDAPGPDADLVDANSDSGIDAAIARDAFLSDMSLPDMSLPDMGIDAPLPDANVDGGPCALPDGGFNICACGMFGPDCSTSSCATGTTCLTDPCGMHCAPSGSPCSGPSDCPSTSTCAPGRTCSHPGGGCGDSRDCPPGHSCDAGACHDRRVGCRPVDGFDCPWGFVCDTDGTPFCLRYVRRCGVAAACEADSYCLDIDGDGLLECSAMGTCRSNTTCTGGLVCGTRPAERFASCERYGPCRTAADCSSGMLCRDLWGDGVRECVEPGGSCSAQTDCPGRSICGTPTDGGPPVCLSTPL